MTVSMDGGVDSDNTDGWWSRLADYEGCSRL